MLFVVHCKTGNKRKRVCAMTTSIARQSVILKCTMGKSVMLGNYEFYYCGGLCKKLFGLAASEDMKPLELSEYLLGQLENVTPKDEREEYLIKIILSYEPLENYDDQMKELFRWGVSEPYLWSVKTGYHP